MVRNTGPFREIVLDTETTGLDIKKGHRVIEIGCVELIDRKKSGNTFHTYVNPQRSVDIDAIKVHGIKNSFLRDKPIFSKVANALIAFIGTSNIIMHNAPFDTKFLNHEFVLCGKQTLEKHRIVDSLTIARKKFPGSPASLDALCKRFKISLDDRTKHSALLDAELLASVYLLMQGKVQTQIALDVWQKQSHANDKLEMLSYNKRTFYLSESDMCLHKQMLQKIHNPIWLASKTDDK